VRAPAEDPTVQSRLPIFSLNTSSNAAHSGNHAATTESAMGLKCKCGSVRIVRRTNVGRREEEEVAAHGGRVERDALVAQRCQHRADRRARRAFNTKPRQQRESVSRLRSSFEPASTTPHRPCWRQRACAWPPPWSSLRARRTTATVSTPASVRSRPSPGRLQAVFRVGGGAMSQRATHRWPRPAACSWCSQSCSVTCCDRRCTPGYGSRPTVRDITAYRDALIISFLFSKSQHVTYP
jgi:hypothetical protein